MTTAVVLEPAPLVPVPLVERTAATVTLARPLVRLRLVPVGPVDPVDPGPGVGFSDVFVDLFID